jgi:SAM-dependent methyltransferase
MSIWYGANVADESELRLCGDVAGKRVIELGIPTAATSLTPSAVTPNSVTAAIAGAKAMALDPSPQAIAAVRAAADRAEVKVQCHQGDLADLGFATSASVDLVVASHTLAGVDDLPRLLRQVHRVLKPGAPFVVAMTHPVAAMFGSNDHTAIAAYGANSTTFTELYMSFERSNFRLDVVHELNDHRVREAFFPSVLIVRARKQGD